MTATEKLSDAYDFFSGFHMITMIVEIELYSILAIVVATTARIAGGWFLYDRNAR